MVLRPVRPSSIDEKTDTKAYIAYWATDNKIVLSFRGSQSFTNWLYNLQFAKTGAYPHCEGCRVHAGFYQSWQSVEQTMTQQIHALIQENPKAQLYITGHSLGGSLAVLSAAHFAAVEGIPVAGVYTFGESRVASSRATTTPPSMATHGA